MIGSQSNSTSAEARGKKSTCERQGMILDSKIRRNNFQTRDVQMFSFQCYEDFCPYLAHELKIMQLTDINYLLHHTNFSPWKFHAIKFTVFKVISKFPS
jgi:hypothetical protein